MAGASLTVAAHLKAAAEDISLDHFLGRCIPESTQRYIIALLRAYWGEAAASGVIADVVEWFPADCVLQLRAFCAANYPEHLSDFEC